MIEHRGQADAEEPVWHSPGFRRLAVSGVLASLVGGAAGGFVSATVLLAVTAVTLNSVGDAGTAALGLVIYGPIGSLFGLVIGGLIGLPTAPLFAAWLGRDRLAGQPITTVADLARWWAAAVALIVVALGNLTALDLQPPQWLTWYLTPSVLVVAYAWFVSGQIVLRTVRRPTASFRGAIASP